MEEIFNFWVITSSDMSELLGQRLTRRTLRDITVKDLMISFRDNEESLKIRIWL